MNLLLAHLGTSRTCTRRLTGLLEQNGSDATEAKALLVTFLETQLLYEASRDLIQREIDVLEETRLTNIESKDGHRFTSARGP